MLRFRRADSLAGETRDPTAAAAVSPDDLRAQMVKAGVWLTVAACVTGALYALATWEQTNRSLLMTLFGIGAAMALAIHFVQPRRLLRSRYSDAFFVAWSLAVIMLAAVGVAADHGARSPHTVV